MYAALKSPGMSNYWTMPIRGRIEMLATGIRTPVGLKIQGGDVNQIQQVGRQVEAALASVPGTRSAFAERTGEGYFLDVSWDRGARARFGLSVVEATNAVTTAQRADAVAAVNDGRHM